MDRDCSVVRFREVILNYVEEVFDNFLWRIRAIDEEEIVVRNASVLEMRPIILDIVQSYYLGHSNVVENVYVLSRMLSVTMLGIPVLDRSHKSYKLSRDDPVEVSVLDSLVVLILLDIEGSEVIPSKPHGVFESLQAMENCAIVEALTLRGIPIVSENWMVLLELRVSVLCLHLEYDDHECSHKECSVDNLVSRILRGAVVENLIL